MAGRMEGTVALISGGGYPEGQGASRLQNTWHVEVAVIGTPSEWRTW